MRDSAAQHSKRKADYYKLAENIWAFMFISFALDVLLGNKISADSNSSFYYSYLCTFFLILSLIFNSETFTNISIEKIVRFQIYSRSKSGLKSSLILYALLAIFILADLFMRFAALMLNNIIFLFLVLAIATFALTHAVREKRKHDLLMQNDYSYFYRHFLTQNLIFCLLPAISARVAVFFAALETHLQGYSIITLVQLSLGILLFFQSYPKRDLFVE